MFKNKKNKVLALAGIGLTFGIYPIFANTAKNNTQQDMLTRQSSSGAVLTSNMFTQYRNVQDINWYNQSLEGFIHVSSSNYLNLYVQPETLAIKVQNRVTGYIFSSTLDNFEDYRLNNIWIQFVESPLTIEFVNQNGSIQRESLTSSPASSWDMHILENGFTAYITFGNSGINLELHVELHEADINVSIDRYSIIEPEGVGISRLYVYPFMGATKEDNVDGYMFIPDGSGALIRYGETSMTSAFRGNVFGNNMGFAQTHLWEAVPPFDIRMPVFGKTHGEGQNAFVAFITDGAEYAEIFAYTAGLITEFNRIGTAFTYRHSFSRSTTADGNRGPSVLAHQEQSNIFDVGITYRFLWGENAGHVGMALAYQDHLREIGVLTPRDNTAMMQLAFFGGDMTEGIFWDVHVPMTEVSDIVEHVDTLIDMGMSSFLVNYTDFGRGGFAGNQGGFSIARSLGNENAVRDTISALENRQIDMFLSLDYSRVFNTGLFLGNNLARDIANQYIIGEDIYPNYHMHTASAVVTAFNDDLDRLSNMGVSNVNFNLPNSISTFNRGEPVARSYNIEAFREMARTHNMTALGEPNMYMWQYTDKFFNIPMLSSRYTFVTDSVPFLQIVLRGYIPFYTEPLNFSSNIRRDVLRVIDYGAYPSFWLTTQSAHLLADSNSSYLLSSQFDVWKDTVLDVYNTVTQALSYVSGEHIVNRQMLGGGVSVTTYSNGVDIIVNYTGDYFTYGSITVAPEDFIVIGGR